MAILFPKARQVERIYADRHFPRYIGVYSEPALQLPEADDGTVAGFLQSGVCPRRAVQAWARLDMFVTITSMEDEADVVEETEAVALIVEVVNARGDRRLVTSTDYLEFVIPEAVSVGVFQAFYGSRQQHAVQPFPFTWYLKKSPFRLTPIDMDSPSMKQHLHADLLRLAAKGEEPSAE